MKEINTQNAAYIPLFSDKKEPQDFDVYVFGSNEPSDKEKDTFRKALKRYLTDYNVSPARLTSLQAYPVLRYIIISLTPDRSVSGIFVQYVLLSDCTRQGSGIFSHSPAI